jgi:hypothetical protein
MPHHTIVRGGEVQENGWDAQSDDLIAEMLTKRIGLKRSATTAWLEKIKGLAFKWSKDLDIYGHRSASRWLDLESTLLDDAQSQIGRHCPCPDSTCGWWSEDNPIVSNQSDDGVADGQPCLALPIVDNLDREVWISEWVKESRANKNKKSYRVSLVLLLSIKY